MHTNIHQRVELFGRVLNEVPEIVYAGNPVLREHAENVSLEEGCVIAQELEHVLLKYRALTGWGRGLAAPQIGKSKAVFVTYVDDRPGVFLNPRIVERSEHINRYRELCMSAGIIAADVERPESIVLSWTDEKGRERTEQYDGFLARLYQHEEAHLRGRLNLDDAVDGGISFVTFDPLKEVLRT